MTADLQKAFIHLVRLGIGHIDSTGCTEISDWEALKALAGRQGLTAVVLDGIEEFKRLNVQGVQGPDQHFLLQWIGEVMQNYEARYVAYEKAISSLAGSYNQHGFKMMVLKGYACSLDWPKPGHRPCGDIDIWLFGQYGEADAALAREKGIKIDKSHHHHTVFYWGDFMVENHYDFVNVHAKRSSKELEVIFKELGSELHLNFDDNDNRGIKKGCKIQSVKVNGEKVHLPSPNLHALFLIRHMVSHFAAAEISLRHVLDWAFFVEKHGMDVDWEWLICVLKKYHMKELFDCINAICVEDLGFEVSIFHGVQFRPDLKDKILDDIIEPEYGTAGPRGLIARWAYKYKRWQGNAWKQRMCYPESRWESFWTLLRSHIIKPEV